METFNLLQLYQNAAWDELLLQAKARVEQDLPQDHEAYHYLGLAYQGLGKNQEAAICLVKSLHLIASPPKHYYLSYAKTLEALFRQSEAEKAYESVLALDQQDLEAHLGLGRLALGGEGGDLNLALYYFQQALSLSSEPKILAQIYTHLAKLNLKLENLEAASTHLDYALYLDDGCLEALILRLEILDLNQAPNEALDQAFQQALTQAPEMAEIWHDYALWLLQQTDDYQTKAHQAFEMALSYQPKLSQVPQLYWPRARAAWAKGLNDLAFELYNLALEQASDKDELILTKVDWLFSLGHFDQALQDLTSLIENCPEEHQTHKLNLLMRQAEYACLAKDYLCLANNLQQWPDKLELEQNYLKDFYQAKQHLAKDELEKAYRSLRTALTWAWPKAWAFVAEQTRLSAFLASREQNVLKTLASKASQAHQHPALSQCFNKVWVLKAYEGEGLPQVVQDEEFNRFAKENSFLIWSKSHLYLHLLEPEWSERSLEEMFRLGPSACFTYGLEKTYQGGVSLRLFSPDGYEHFLVYLRFKADALYWSRNGRTWLKLGLAPEPKTYRDFVPDLIWERYFK